MMRVVFPLLLGAALISPVAVSALSTLPAASPVVGTAEVPVSPVPEMPVLHAEPLRFPHPLGDAFLFAPAACTPTCPLVVVSHSRGMTAELSLTRPHLMGIFRRLQSAGYAVLVSNDAGPTTWGAPQALTYLADMHSRASRSFPFNGRTYTFGYSMGGLPALLTAAAGVYPVAGVVLLDAQVSLENVWRGGNPTFMTDIAAAHGLQPGEALPPGRDPWRDFGSSWATLPVLVAGSAADTAVSFAHNGEILHAHASAPHSQLLRLDGPHLGGSHFGEALLGPMLAFLDRLERPQQSAPVMPEAPLPAPPETTPDTPAPATPAPARPDPAPAPAEPLPAPPTESASP